MNININNDMERNSENKFQIVTDKKYYYSGEEVTGNIHLNITKEINAQKIILKIKCNERAQWKESNTVAEAVRLSKTTVMKSKNITTPYCNEIMLYNHKIPVFQSEQQFLQPGQYSIPFEFRLDEKFPSSFYFKDSDMICQIVYLLELQLNNQDQNQFVHEFQVIETSKVSNIKNEHQQILYPKSCFCIPMGSIVLKLKLDKQQYSQGEIAKLIVEADNSQSKISIPTITGYLYNYLKIFTKYGHSNTITKLCGVTEIQGVQAGETALNSQRKEMTLKLVDLNDSHQLQPTTNGKAIVNQYFFKITSELEGSCFCSNQNLEIQLPIEVIIKQDEKIDQKIAIFQLGESKNIKQN